MNDIDKTTFERFARSFARVERLVPDRALRPARPSQTRWPASRAVGFAAVAILALTVVGLAAIGTNTLPRPTESAASHLGRGPCWPEGDDFTYIPTSLEGVLWVEGGNIGQFWLGLPDGRQVDVGWPLRFTISAGPGAEGVVRNEIGQVVAAAGEHVTLWGGLVRADGAPRPPGSQGRDALVVCEINGVRFTPVPDRNGQLPSPTPGPARPTPAELQVANRELGGQGWTIIEVDRKPLAEVAYLSFSGGPTGGPANGYSSSDCWFITFDYTYVRAGPGIAFFTRADGQGSGADGCSDEGLADYAAIADALGRVAMWRKPQAGMIELVDASGNVVLRGGPLPPLPTPQVSGDCGDVPLADCQRAVAVAFNFGFFPASGQTLVSWSVRPAAYSSCASQGVDPKYDVVFQLANPAEESSETIGDLFGKLVACGNY